jgi:hypothetical protein
MGRKAFIFRFSAVVPELLNSCLLLKILDAR